MWPVCGTLLQWFPKWEAGPPKTAKVVSFNIFFICATVCGIALICNFIFSLFDENSILVKNSMFYFFLKGWELTTVLSIKGGGGEGEAFWEPLQSCLKKKTVKNDGGSVCVCVGTHSGISSKCWSNTWLLFSLCYDAVVSSSSPPQPWPKKKSITPYVQQTQSLDDTNSRHAYTQTHTHTLGWVKKS